MRLTRAFLVLAKISDLAGRPNTFTLVLCLYTMGFIIVASSATLSAYIVGDVFISIGFNGISFLCTGEQSKHPCLFHSLTDSPPMTVIIAGLLLSLKYSKTE